MKKLIALLLVLAMALTLAACGGETAPETTAAPAETEATEAPAETEATEAAEAPAGDVKVSVFWY